MRRTTDVVPEHLLSRRVWVVGTCIQTLVLSDHVRCVVLFGPDRGYLPAVRSVTTPYQNAELHASLERVGRFSRFTQAEPDHTTLAVEIYAMTDKKAKEAVNPASKSDPHEACAEVIATLSVLHSVHPVPVPPSTNRLDHLPRRPDTYALTLEEERELTGVLAFLSNIKDDTDHIPAVCVAENKQSGALHVLLAVNKLRHDDGYAILQQTKQGFEAVLTAISQGYTALETKVAQERKVFEAIITMCEERILCRLRLRRKRFGTPKQSFSRALQEASRLLKRSMSRAVWKKEGLLFEARVKEVLNLIVRWTKYQKPGPLGELVEGIRRLQQTCNVQGLLDRISNRDMLPNARKSLLNIVNKVARYRVAATVLRRTARRVPAVQQMTVVLVDLPVPAFSEIPPSQEDAALATILSRNSTSVWENSNTSRLCQLLKVEEPALIECLLEQKRKTMKEAKIHAEIQLLYYCSVKTFAHMQPRVICSSKDACFLCNAFILMHGGIHTPRSHGKLYPGWRLPHMSALLDVTERFQRLLQEHAQSKLDGLLSNKPQRFLADLNESTLLTLIPSQSTLQSLATTRVISRAPPEMAQSRSVGNMEGPHLIVEQEALEGGEVPPIADDRAITSSPEPALRSRKVFGNQADRIPSPESSFKLETDAESKHEKENRVIGSDTSIPPVLDEKGSSSSSLVDRADSGSPVERVYQPAAMSGSNDDTTGKRALSSPVACDTATHPPEFTDVRLLTSLEGQHEYANHMRGHESRTCDTQSECNTSEAQPMRQLVNVLHSDCVSRKFDFHEMELFFEVEAPATAMFSIQKISSTAEQAPAGTSVVDVGKMAPGIEMILSADGMPHDEKQLRLMMRDKSGKLQQLSLHWKTTC